MMRNDRIQSLLGHMASAGLEQIAIRQPLLVEYFLGFTPYAGDRATILYISAKTGPRLVVNVLCNYPKDLPLEYVLHTDREDVCAVLAGVADKNAPLGFDAEYPAKWLLPLQEQGFRLRLAAGVLNAQRAVKDEGEQAALRAASALNDRVMARARGLLRDGITEREVATELARLFREEGADNGGWSLVAFGENCANVHNRSGDRALRPGDPVLIDMGAPLKGYHADMTRTFFWKSVSEEQRAVYELVKNANLAAEAAAKPGITCAGLDAVARNMIAEAGHGPAFSHRLGHYIGLELHDPGDIAGYNPAPLAPGMAFSIEPGVYLEGRFGVRVEDLVIVTETGIEVLNRDNKELEILGV